MPSDDMVSNADSGDFRRTRTLATGLFVFMAGLFVFALLWESAYPSLAWLRAFAEAAMVGALADWYAVTALFKRPLGLPIPHTEIIPRNKIRIASTIGSLTQRKLVTPEAIGRLVDSWRIPEELTAMMSDPSRRQTLTHEMAHALARMLDASEDAAMQRLIRHLATGMLQGVGVSSLTGQLLSSFLQSPQRDRLMHDGLTIVSDYVESHRDTLSCLIAEKLPWSRLLSLVKLDEKVANKLVDWLRAMLRDMRDDPDDPVRQQLLERLERAAHWLMHSDAALRQEAALKERLLTYDTLLQFLDDSWHRLKQWLLSDLRQEHSETRAYLDAALAGLGNSLKTDAALLRLFREGLLSLVVDLATRHRDRIGELVTATVHEWSVAHLVETIEREVGKDLQFIRINGALVGGLVGLALHAIAVLIDRL